MIYHVRCAACRYLNKLQGPQLTICAESTIFCEKCRKWQLPSEVILRETLQGSFSLPQPEQPPEVARFGYARVADVDKPA